MERTINPKSLRKYVKVLLQKIKVISYLCILEYIKNWLGRSTGSKKQKSRDLKLGKGQVPWKSRKHDFISKLLENRILYDLDIQFENQTGLNKYIQSEFKCISLQGNLLS